MSSQPTDQTLGFELIKHGFVKPQIKLLSDTIAVSLTFSETAPENVSNSPYILVGTICLLTIKIINYFLTDVPHLLLRGCITYGEHIAEQNFLIGKSVDEAAEYMDLPNGAFVWFTPPAEEKFKQFEREFAALMSRIDLKKLLFNNVLPISRYDLASRVVNKAGLTPIAITDYEMPIKNGEKLITTVVNPVSFIK